MPLTIMESKVCGQKLDSTTEHFLDAPSVTFFGIANYEIYRLWENIQQTYRHKDIQTCSHILTNKFLLLESLANVCSEESYPAGLFPYFD